jgi:tetratricopeptide (TPR) repeat protein
MLFDRLGGFQWNTGDSNGSLKSLLRAVQLAPKDPLPHLHLGQDYLEMNQRNEAIAQFRSSLKLRETAQARGAMGSVYLELKNWDLAAAHFRKACQLDPASYRYPVGLGLSLRYSWQPGARSNSIVNFRLALAKLEDNLDVGGNKAQVQAYRGLCLAGAGQAVEARQVLASARPEVGQNKHLLKVIETGESILEEVAAPAK